MSEQTAQSADDTDRSIGDVAREYLRSLEREEAAIESFLADLAEEYYEPGYLYDEEWESLKKVVRSDEFDTDDTLVVVKVAALRKATTELGREDEVEQDWPAKGERSNTDTER